jgi:hypothetical protein
MDLEVGYSMTLISDLTFEEWVQYVFDHPAEEMAWHWDIDADDLSVDESHTITVAYLTQLFKTSGKALLPFTDAQVDQGLNYLASNACSNHMYALLDEAVPWSDRQRCIRSMLILFEDCFARRCTPTLAHCNEPGSSPINGVCYMWFDIIPINSYDPKPEQAGVEQEFLNLMESMLKIDHDACRESALHGLGHWHERHTEKRVTSIIDTFLRRNPFLRAELKEYAQYARLGRVQ